MGESIKDKVFLIESVIEYPATKPKIVICDSLDDVKRYLFQQYATSLRDFSTITVGVVGYASDFLRITVSEVYFWR